MSTPLALAVALALLAANAFFVAAEFALLAARRSRLEQLAAAGDRRAPFALRSLKELSLMLAGAQLGITMASLGLGAVAEPAVADVIEGGLHAVAVPEAMLHPVAFTVALALVVFVHMVAGEMAPKSWAVAHPEASALRLAPPFRAFATVVRPAIYALNATANALVRLVGVEPQGERSQVHSARDLALLIRESADQGSVPSGSARLLARSLELSGLDALAAMAPRREVVAVPAGAAVDEIEATAARTGRSRLVVYEGDLDHPVGAVHVRDVLVLPDGERAVTTAGELARPVLVTHEGHALETLLVEMRRESSHLAVVADELGTVVGIVTLEDVLEELVGEFYDETDRAHRRVHRRCDGTWDVAGTVRPDELEEHTGIRLPPGEWDTVAGYVIAALDRIPAVGDTVEEAGVRMAVASMDGFAVTRLVVSGPDGDGGGLLQG